MSTLTLKRKDLTLKEKVEVLGYVNRVKCSQSEVARKFGISQAQVSKLLMKREEVLRDWQKNSNSSQKRKRSGKDSIIDSELLKWYKDKKACNIPLNGPLLMAKAEQIAEANGLAQFRATNGWLHRWKNRSNVQTLRKFLEEPKDVSIATCSNGMPEEFPHLMESCETRCVYGTTPEHVQLIKNYEPNCIYVCEETTMYYRAAQESMLCFIGEKVVEGDSKKDILTVHCCANADGSHKLEPYVIGTLEKPKCFKNIKTLPVKYASNKRACMTVTSFKDWLIAFDKQMIRIKRKPLLYVGNNFYLHKPEIRLNNVTVHYLSSNAAPVQGNQGIISLFKGNYRKELVKTFLVSLDCHDSSSNSLDEMSKKLSLLSTIHMINVAWTRVTIDSIKKCFDKYKFSNISSERTSVLPPSPQCIVEETNSFITFDDTHKLAEIPDIKSEVVERSLNIDDPLCFVDVQTVVKSEVEEDGVKTVSMESEYNDDANSFQDAQEVPSAREVRTACNVLRKFLESKSNVDFTHYYNIENQITDLMHGK